MKLISLLSLATIILVCTGCNKSSHDSMKKNTDSVVLYDLNESTEIIIQLLKTNELSKILADAKKEEIDTLIKNFSPAEMALEAEALNYPGKALLIFYHDNKQTEQLKELLSQLATKYSQAKFIMIDADKLFKITDMSQVEEFPALLVLENRAEINRLEPLNLATLANDFNQLLSLSDTTSP